jgi:archaellum component FlaC
VDVETASAIDRLIERIDSLETSLRGDIARLDARFGQSDARLEHVDGRFDRIDARFEQVDARFEQVDARFEQVDARFSSLQASIEEVRRHAVMLNEATREDIRLVAEAVAVLTVKVDKALQRP